MCGFRNPVCFPFLLQTDSPNLFAPFLALGLREINKNQNTTRLYVVLQLPFRPGNGLHVSADHLPPFVFSKISGFHILSHFLFRTTPLLRMQKGCCVFLHIFCFDWMLCPVFSTAVHSVCIIEGVQTAASLECTSANFVYMAGNLDVCQATASQKRTLPDGCHTVWQGDAG